MRRLDWFLAAVIGAFLIACLAEQALSHAMADLAGGAADARQVQRLVSPHGDPVSVACPSLLRQR
jgi:hypothetical protein